MTMVVDFNDRLSTTGEVLDTGESTLWKDPDRNTTRFRRLTISVVSGTIAQSVNKNTT